MFTLVSIICDDVDIQNVLPQVLLVNEKHLSKFEPAANLRQMLDAHTTLWVVKKVWMTSELMCKVIKLLKQALRPYRNT